MATDFLTWIPKETVTDDQLILRCLNNAPCGSDKKQLMKLIKKYEELTNGV